MIFYRSLYLLFIVCWHGAFIIKKGFIKFYYYLLLFYYYILIFTIFLEFIEILSSFADDAKIVEVHNPSISISDKGIENKAETIVKPRLVLDKKLE